MADQRAALDAAMAGGVVGYVQRIRDGGVHAAHRPTFSNTREGGIVYSGCSCGELGCAAPIWLAHIDDLIAAYNLKVQDFAKETLRASELHAEADRSYALIEAARAVHPPRESQYGGSICDGCNLPWPCPTIKALAEV